MTPYLGMIEALLGIWAIISIIDSLAGRRRKVIWVLVVAILPVLGFLAWLVAGPKPART